MNWWIHLGGTISFALRTTPQVKLPDMILQNILLFWFTSLRVASARCRTSFHDYTSSPLELKWIRNVNDWQLDVCIHISDEEMNWWIGNVTVLMDSRDESAVVTQSATPPTSAWSYVFSVFTYKKTCKDPESGSSKTEFIHIPIEPTAAIARDPRKCWEPMTEKYTQSKEYLLPLSQEGAAYISSRSVNGGAEPASNVTRFLFDAGATFPGKGKLEENNWSGTDWIYKWYEKRGIVFDQVYGWEPSDERFDKNELEPAMAKALHFFNVGITDKPRDEHNPLARIRALCKPKDIVVLKLDIDDDLEMNVVKQLLSDPELMGLVDEFYFEHHVHNDLMRMHGLGGNTQPDLKSWYDMVLPARRKGFHMHFWP